MAPKQSKPAGYNADTASASSSTGQTLTDEQVAQMISDEEMASMLQNLENLSINDLDKMEQCIAKDKDTHEKALKEKKATLTKVVAKKNELLKPIKEAEAKAKMKARVAERVQMGKADRERMITLKVIDSKGGVSHFITVPRGSTTGHLRAEIYHAFGLAKKAKLGGLIWNSKNIYFSGGAEDSKGLKRLHILGIEDGDTIYIIYGGETLESLMNLLAIDEADGVQSDAENIDEDYVQSRAGEIDDDDDDDDDENKSDDGENKSDADKDDK